LKKFEDILVQCIEDIKAGRSSIEDCLNRYPSLRERLEPLLRIALAIRETPDVKPSPAFKIRARVQLMDQIHERQTVTKWPWSRYNTQTKPIPQRRRFKMVKIIVAIVLTLSVMAGGTIYAAQDSLPGDFLYAVKLGTEQVGMMLPGDDAARGERALGFAERRVEEMVALAEMGRMDDLDLAVDKYDYALNMALTRIEEAGDRGLATGNITMLVAEATIKHLSVLDEVYDLVPEEAKPAIARATEKALAGYDRAVQILEQLGIEVPPLPEGIGGV